MRIDRTLAQQAEVLVDVEVAARLRKQFTRPFDFVDVFRDMAVDEYAGMLSGEAAGRFELGIGGGDGKARGDGVVQPATAVPFFDQGRGVAVAAVRRVAQIFRTVAVHQNLARDHAQIARLGLGEEGIHRNRVHGAEHQGRGCAVAHQFVQKKAGAFRGMSGVREAAFGRERVVVQPVEQLRGRGRDHVGLRIVDVRVDEARHQQAARMVHDLRSRRQGRQQVARFACSFYEAIFHDQQAVVEILHGGPIRAVPRIAEEMQ